MTTDNPSNSSAINESASQRRTSRITRGVRRLQSSRWYGPLSWALLILAFIIFLASMIMPYIMGPQTSGQLDDPRLVHATTAQKLTALGSFIGLPISMGLSFMGWNGISIEKKKMFGEIGHWIFAITIVAICISLAVAALALSWSLLHTLVNVPEPSWLSNYAHQLMNNPVNIQAPAQK